MVNPLSITTYIEDLRRGGVEEPVAMTYAKALGRFMNDEFASKSDLREHTNHLEGEINLVRRDIETKFASLDIRFATLEERFNSRIDALENRMMVRLGGLMVAGIGIVLALEKLLN